MLWNDWGWLRIFYQAETGGIESLVEGPGHDYKNDGYEYSQEMWALDCYLKHYPHDNECIERLNSTGQHSLQHLSNFPTPIIQLLMFAKVAQLFPGTIVQNYGQTHLQWQQCFWNYNRAFQGSSSGGKRYKKHLQLVMSILDAIRTRNNDHWELQWQWLTSISITIQHQNLTSLPQFWKWHWHNEERHGSVPARHSYIWQYNIHSYLAWVHHCE